MLISISSSIAGSLHWTEFRKWVEAEWGEVDPFEGKHGETLPPPILAFGDGALIGGLSFTYFPAPGTTQVALWINTLLVAPAARRKGIGSRLVHAAANSVARMGIQQLYVHTRIPELYQNLGWHICGKATGDNTILRKECLDAAPADFR